MMTSSLYLYQRYQLPSRKTQGKTFIINQKKGTYIALEGTGLYIWELLKKKLSKNDILSKILAEYSIDEKTAKKDLNEFLNATLKAEIIEQIKA